MDFFVIEGVDVTHFIQRIMRVSPKPRKIVEIEVLAGLIENYRGSVKTFSWEAVREVIIDRLEGSRRSLKGHEKESLVRIRRFIH